MPENSRAKREISILSDDQLNTLGYVVGSLNVCGNDGRGRPIVNCLHCPAVVILALPEKISRHYVMRHSEILRDLFEKRLIVRANERPKPPSTKTNPADDEKVYEWTTMMQERRSGRVNRKCVVCDKPAAYNSDGCSDHDPR